MAEHDIIIEKSLMEKISAAAQMFTKQSASYVYELTSLKGAGLMNGMSFQRAFARIFGIFLTNQEIGLLMITMAGSSVHADAIDGLSFLRAFFRLVRLPLTSADLSIFRLPAIPNYKISVGTGSKSPTTSSKDRKPLLPELIGSNPWYDRGAASTGFLTHLSEREIRAWQDAHKDTEISKSQQQSGMPETEIKHRSSLLRPRTPASRSFPGLSESNGSPQKQTAKYLRTVRDDPLLRSSRPAAFSMIGLSRRSITPTAGAVRSKLLLDPHSAAPPAPNGGEERAFCLTETDL